MKRIIISIMAAAVCLAGQTASAQTLKDLLKKATNNETVKNVVESVTGTTLPVDVKGTWTYSGTAVKFESEDLLKSTAASLAAGQVEDKLDEYVQKVGIKAGTFSFTFNEDKTCSYIVKGKKVEGTYEFDPEAKTITIKGGKLGVKVTAQVVTLGGNMSFLFDADKLLSVVKTITGVASKFSTQASALNKLTEKFNGLLVGFELQKQ